LQNEAESLRMKLQHVDSKSAQVDLLHGSDDKSNPDVVALEQTKLSEKLLLTFVINMQKFLNYVLIFFLSLCRWKRRSDRKQ
jgi:hypothetical protein